MDLNVGTSFSMPTSQKSPLKANHRYTRDDFKCICMLIALYIVQGMPLGVRAALPLVIYDKASYSQMAYLSCTVLPFCIKLLWAPVVDALYIKRVGKRKSWIIPMQLMCALLLFYGSAKNKIDRWAGCHGESVNMVALVVYFTALHLLMATQDIVVDGWALTMLRRDMREHASTCNAVGQSIGMNIAYVGFTTLSTVKVSVKLYRAWIWLSACFGVHRPALSHEEEATFQPYATISDFTWFFGLFTLLVTFVVMFKREGNEGDEPTLKELPGVTELRIRDDPNRRKLAEIRRSYAQLLEVVKIKPVRLLGVALLTCNFFYAAENPAELKLLEKGVPMDIFAMITPIMIPLQIIGPPFITMAIRNSSTAEVIYKGLKVHLVAMALCIVLVYVAGMFYAQQSYHWFESALFYAIFFGISLFRKICALVVSVAFIALFAKVADPSVGGTYMTLLNTLANVGELIPQMVGLWLIDILGSAKPGGTDGLYVEALLCVIAGVVFLPRYKYMLKRVESFQVDEWYVNKFSSE